MLTISKRNRNVLYGLKVTDFNISLRFLVVKIEFYF